MTSSTLSSSRTRARRNNGVPWVRVWIVALVVVGVVAGIWEYALREAGLGPQYVDNRALWADTRHRLNSAGPDAIVLLGASRHQRAVDVETLSAATGRPVFQLSLEGTSALPLLENLAADPRFRGTVVYSVAPAFSFNRQLSKLDGGDQAKWVRFYADQSWVRRAEQSLRLRLQGALALRSPDAALPRVVPALLSERALPSADFRTVFGDRSVHIDYTIMPGRNDSQGIVDLYLENTAPYTDEEFATVVNYFATLVRVLREKGSDVFIVRLPSEREVLDLERRMFPEAVFWGAMQRHIDATLVHFDEHPELSGYMSQDGSHVDSDRNEAFTAVFAEVLKSRGLR